MLVILVVIKNSNNSEWGSQPFPQSKPKTNRVHFLSDYINLNKQLKHKPYPIHNINEFLLKWEIFKYDT